MLRGITKKVEKSVERRVTYDLTREILLKRLRLPADTVVYVAGEIVVDGAVVFQAAVTETK